MTLARSAALAALFLGGSSLLGQEAVVIQAGATPAVATPAAVQPSPMPAGRAASPMPQPGEAETKKKPDDAEGEKGEKKKENADAAPPPVARPKEPPAPGDPAELRVRPSDDGVIRFSFRNQPWPAVLQWLADVSRLSLDWQELPGDYLNLTLHRDYTLEEARDLINRHLLARGYTMILDGETLTVVNLAKVNPGIVPRVTPEELADRLPHDVVRVSFPLRWMLAEKAAEELKPMLGAHGKLHPLKESNRLEAMDAVVNLREIHRLLSQEQSDGGEERLVREFVLQYARAADVRELLMELLGVEPKSKGPAGPMTPEQMQMMQRQQAMMQQMAQQQGGAAAAAGGKEEDVSLIINPRNNSILATAPPDKMAILAEAVTMLDVPPAQGASLLANMTKLQIYRLSGIEPEPLVKTLQELGDLSPQTRLEVDAKNRAIIAYATLADHVTIRTMVEKLDGSARSLEVIPLRRLAADYVAGTLKFLLAGEEEKPQRRYPSYFYYGYGGDRSDERSKDGFRVDADVENNRLLVWANPTELEEVLSLLVKLGEIPQRGGDPRRVRTLEIVPSQQSPEFLRRLEEAWRSTAPNELRVDPALERRVPAPRSESAPTPPAAEPQPQAAPGDVTASPAPGDGRRGDPAMQVAIRLAQLRRGAEAGAVAPPSSTTSPAGATPDAGDKNPGRTGSGVFFSQPTNHADALLSKTDSRPVEAAAQAAAPPVAIRRGPDGRLVISSQDPAALDLLEDLVREMAPRRRDFDVFQLKYAPAFWVRMNLEDFFKEDDKQDNRNSFYRWWYYDMPSESDQDDPRRLSQRRPLKFISDDDTNTIVVQGADPQQLQTIEELIQLYDQPPPEDSQSRRVTQIFAIRYSKADVIAEAVKDVYRDLLSANDKALQQQQQQQNQRPAGETYITNIGFGAEEEQRDRRTQVTFKGKLSIGVDPLTNTLLVSTEGEALMRNIQEMVLRLDEAARPRATVEVLQVSGLGRSGLQQALVEIFREQALSGAGQPQQHRPGQPGAKENGAGAAAPTGGAAPAGP